MSDDFLPWVSLAIIILFASLIAWVSWQRAKGDALNDWVDHLEEQRRQAERDHLRKLQIEYYERHRDRS